jgi:hypothetical protein
MAVKKFARWLRCHYEFPVPIYIFLSPRDKLKTRGSQTVSAFFFFHVTNGDKPFIKISTGDYPELKRSEGRNNALGSILNSVAHEVIHYHQWLESGDTRERGVVVRADSLVKRYGADVNWRPL